MPDQNLTGVKLLIPRPEPGGTSTASLVESHGGDAIVFPVLEITAPSNFRELDQIIQNLDALDILVLVSIHAVNGFASRLRYHAKELPKSVNIAVVGPKTATACAAKGIPVCWKPIDRFDSEGLLLAMNETAMENKRIAILRSQDGRDFLFEAFQSRGARVEYVNCYQRKPTSRPIASVLDIWRSGGINCVLITSESILDTLQSLLGQEHADMLQKTPVLTISGRLADSCKKAGVQVVHRAASMDDASILFGLKQLLD